MGKNALILAVGLIVLALVLFTVLWAVAGFRLDGMFPWFRKEAYTTLTPVTYEISGTFTALDIRSDSGNVELQPSDGTSMRVECAECDAWKHTVQVRDGVLEVKRERDNKISVNLLSFDQDVIRVYVPSGEYESITVSVTSGDVSLPDSFRFGEAAISATSGDILISSPVSGSLAVSATSGGVAVRGSRSIQASDVTVSTTSGAVSVSGLTLSGDLKVDSTSGEQNVSDVFCRRLETSSSSGDQTLTDAEATGFLVLKSTSGDVTLTRCDGGEVSIQTTSGDVQGTLRTEKHFETQTSSGKVEIPKGSSVSALCRVVTTSGDIFLTVEK